MQYQVIESKLNHMSLEELEMFYNINSHIQQNNVLNSLNVAFNAKSIEIVSGVHFNEFNKSWVIHKIITKPKNHERIYK